MRNKILKLLLALFMLTALLPLPRFSAVATEPELEKKNLVRNGDFEDSKAMKNTWDFADDEPIVVDKDEDGEIEGKIERVTDLPGNRSGNALKFTTYESKLNIWCQQRFYYPSAPQNSDLSDFIKKSNAFEPGLTYEMSFWIYTEELIDYNSEAMGLFYTFTGDKYKIDNVPILGNGEISYKGETNGVWTRVSGTVTAPSDAKHLRILVRSYAKGTVYFDDISIVATKAEQFEYTTSHMFHYADENEKGVASVSIMPYYQKDKFDIDETHSVSFAVRDENNDVVFYEDDVNFIDYEAVCTYSPDEVLKEKKTKYTLSVSVKDSFGEEVDAFSQSLYRYDRPKFLDKDGNFCGEDGEVIDPFIAWGARDYDMEEAARAGFTMCVLPFDCAKFGNIEGRENFMKAAEEAGLYVIGSLCYNNLATADPDFLDNAEAMVKEYMTEERFVGWIVQDEPLGGNPENKEEIKERLEEAYTTIREYDPNHPVILLDYNMSVFEETSKYCDIFMPNSYGRSHKEVRHYVEEAVKYSNGHPVWPNVAAYANSKGTEEYLPKGEQVQHFIYQAFLAGAKGVSVYDFQQPLPSDKSIHLINTQIWESLVNTGSTEVPVLFDLFVHGNPPEADDGSSDYVERKWTRDDGDYYVLLSASDNGATVEYDIGEGKSVKILGGDDMSDYTLENGKLSVTLKKNIVQNGKEKCFDVQIFKVYDTVKEPQVTLGGIKYVAPYLPPAGVQTFFIAAYKEKDGIAKLQEVKMCERPRIAQEFVSEGEEQDYIIKVLPFDTSLKPLADAAVIPPLPSPAVYE